MVVSGTTANPFAFSSPAPLIHLTCCVNYPNLLPKLLRKVTLIRNCIPSGQNSKTLIRIIWRQLRRALTWFADADLLEVRLLDIVEVFYAGDVEAVPDAQVEPLQLDLGQEVVQPLSVLVHQHDPTGHHSTSGVKEDGGEESCKGAVSVGLVSGAGWNCVEYRN